MGQAQWDMWYELLNSGFIIAFIVRYYYYPGFIDEEMKNQKS